MFGRNNKDTRIKSTGIGLVAGPGVYVANFECLFVEKLNESVH